MKDESLRPHSEFSFLSKPEQGFVRNLYPENLIKTVVEDPQRSMSILFELWRTRRYEDLYELGVIAGAEILNNLDLEDTMAVTITEAIIREPRKDSLFSKFILETAESLLRGAHTVPQGPVSEEDYQRIIEYHDEMFDEVRFNLVEEIGQQEDPYVDVMNYSNRLN